MKIALHKSKKLVNENDLLIVATFKARPNDKPTKDHNKIPFEVSETIKELDKQIFEYLINQAYSENFTGDEGLIYVTSTLGQSKSKSIALLGMGNETTQNVDLFRRAGGESYKIAQKKQAKKLVFVVPQKTTVPLFDVIQALAEGFRLACYQFDRYKTKEKKENRLKEIEFHLPTEPVADHKLALLRAEETAKGVYIARDLINEGPMELNPQKFAEHATKIAHESELSIEILDEKKLKKEKMGLLLAVARAAEPAAPPRLIRLHYKPKKPSKHKIVLIGKGVTFDSGGLDIKTAEGMLDMKSDMSGAASVLGTMSIIGKLLPKIEVIGYMACVENGVGPYAYHPGDIIVSRKGISVEINNTDAEGRLILADAITYAIDHDKPNTIIDIATLTGACMIALGVKTAGIFSNDDALCDAIYQSGKIAGESFWRMPLNHALKDILKSPVADIKNCGDRYGGSITAALFLEEFIESKIKWAHLDIAGPATNHKPHPYLPTGGVGFGIRTLVDYLMGQ